MILPSAPTHHTSKQVPKRDACVPIWSAWRFLQVAARFDRCHHCVHTTSTAAAAATTAATADSIASTTSTTASAAAKKSQRTNTSNSSPKPRKPPCKCTRLLLTAKVLASSLSSTLLLSGSVRANPLVPQLRVGSTTLYHHLHQHARSSWSCCWDGCASAGSLLKNRTRRGDPMSSLSSGGYNSIPAHRGNNNIKVSS